MTAYNWKPIEPLSERDLAIDMTSIRPLYDSWRSAKEKLKESSSDSLKGFTDRLIRSLSVETGILERLYELDRGTTEALVSQGFAEDLVSRSSTDVEPGHLIDVLRDQEAAIQLVMDYVANNRQLSKGMIHQLHEILTRHQNTTSAVDQFGKRMKIPLKKGDYKDQPNNPKRPEGSFHEYCPPIHVDSEMDNLIAWYKERQSEDPLIVAAWLHHRFTQIHPYQDGNGRVGRALITMVLLRADLLPLVVDRDLRVEYIKALESADFGDLEAVCVLFARLERNAILQALSIDTDLELSRDKTLTTAVIGSLGDKFRKRRLEKDERLRRVNGVAESVRNTTRREIELAFTALREPIEMIGEPEIHVLDGGPDRANAHWYKYDVIESGRVSGKYINFSEHHYFSRATMRVGPERLLFVVSLHHVGRELTGIMEATMFAKLESYADTDDANASSEEHFSCSLDPFVLTWNTNPDEIEESYKRWLDAGIAIAIKEFGERL